jgi:membrane-associated phospholipid phosphatase
MLPLALFVLSAAGFLAVYIAAVLTQEGQTVENIALDGSTFVLGGGLLDLVSTPHLALATLAVTAVAVLFRGPRAAARVVLMIAAANVLAQLLKNAILDRPDLIESAAENTFPSGHTVVFASVLLGLVMALPSVLRPVAALFSAAVYGRLPAPRLRLAPRQ